MLIFLRQLTLSSPDTLQSIVISHRVPAAEADAYKIAAYTRGEAMRLVLLALLAALSVSAFADQSVRGYVRKDGTYVAPHFRSSPNQYRFDNYGAKGNVNPYTGEKGYQRHEFSNPPAYNKGRSRGNSTYRNQYRR